MKLLFPKLLITLFAVLALNTAVIADDSMEGKTAYTVVNIWYDHPMKILSTNYHAGAMLPMGTKVTIDEVNRKAITFTEESGATYRIRIHIKHNNIPAEKLVHRLFSAKDPKAKGGKFTKFSKKERNNIENGTIAMGMSKEAVIMAYGYPPTVRTHNIKQNSWTYWKNRWVTRVIRFKNNKVSNIQG